jgi:hypothetical protein
MPPVHKPTGTIAATYHRRVPAPPDSSCTLPRRDRKTGLDAKGVTLELLRLKFYYS